MAAVSATAPTPTQAAAHEAPAAPAAAAEAVAPHKAVAEVTPAAPASAAAPVAAAADEAASMPRRWGRPSIQPQLSEQAKAAARQVRPGAKPETVAVAAQADIAVMPAAAAGTAAFALSTRPLRTRAEAEQVQAAMQSLLKTVGAVRMKVDVLPEGDDWRVVGWPFANRAEADQARTLLVSRGMRVQVVGF